MLRSTFCPSANPQNETGEDATAGGVFDFAALANCTLGLQAVDEVLASCGILASSHSLWRPTTNSR